MTRRFAAQREKKQDAMRHSYTDRQLIGRARHELTKINRREKHKVQSGRCFWCGCKPVGLDITVDHLLPKSKGGSLLEENLVMACASCNKRRASMDAYEFADIINAERAARGSPISADAKGKQDDAIQAATKKSRKGATP